VVDNVILGKFQRQGLVEWVFEDRLALFRTELRKFLDPGGYGALSEVELVDHVW
jgi:hypothetical protein